MAVNKVIYGGSTLIDLSGDTVTADKLLAGYTAHAADGTAITGTAEVLNTSDATATAADMVEGKTAYVNGEKITGTAKNVESGYSSGYLSKTPTTNSSNGQIGFSVKVSEPKNTGVLWQNGASVFMRTEPSNFGDASAEDVASGKTFTSSAGLKVTGTKVDLDTSDATATADDLAEGKTAYVNGEKVTGTHVCSSSGNNCEAYHVTSTSDVLSFQGTGTVKVWGYGAVKSTYTTTLYAFVGDGYYRGASYGAPTKTSATFGLNSDGTLSGLPSGLTALDVIVTRGI